MYKSVEVEEIKVGDSGLGRVRIIIDGKDGLFSDVIHLDDTLTRNKHISKLFNRILWRMNHRRNYFQTGGEILVYLVSHAVCVFAGLILSRFV